MSVFEERDGRLVVRAQADLRGFTLVLETAGEIVEARGDVEGLLGHAQRSLTGRSITELLHAHAGAMLPEILYAAGTNRTMPETVLFLNDANGARVAFRAIGRPAAKRQELMQLLCVYAPDLERMGQEGRGGFAERIDNAMRRQGQGEYALTFVDLGDTAKLRELGLDEEAIRGFTQGVEESLRAASVDGRTAELIEEGRYGVLTRRGEDMGGLRGTLETRIRDVDPAGTALKLSTTAVVLDEETLRGEDGLDALRHAVDRFAEDGLDALIFDDLAGSRLALLARRENRGAFLREILDSPSLALLFRPAVSLATGKVQHLLCELDAVLDGDAMGWDEMVDLARREAGLRKQLDAAICRLVTDAGATSPLPLAFDVDITSLADRVILAGLLRFVQANPRQRLILRIEGFDQERMNRVSALQNLRKAGLLISLRGPEIGVVSPETLSKLPADYIQLDPSLTVEPVSLRAQAPMIAALAQRCRGFGIAVLFEGVMRGDVAAILVDIPGALACGPYFGPAEDDPAMATVPPAERDMLSAMANSPLDDGY